MAPSTSAVSMALIPKLSVGEQPGASAFINPLPIKPLKKGIAVVPSKGTSTKFEVKSSSLKLEKAASGLAAAALTASIIAPDVAEAATGVSPSLKNFLLSIVAGGVVLFALVGAVVGVANFDPVKRS